MLMLPLLPLYWVPHAVWSFVKKLLPGGNLDSLRGQGFQVFAWEDLAEVPGGWLADADGRLWKVARGEPLEGFRPNTHAVALGRGYVVKAEVISLHVPRTLVELEQRVQARDARPHP
jgi:hypothetical protein